MSQESNWYATLFRVLWHALVSQLVEEAASKSAQCGFESHRGHQKVRVIRHHDGAGRIVRSALFRILGIVWPHDVAWTGGTGELRSSVSAIDMGAQLDGLQNSLTGGGEVQSFTSAENTEVSAVQFALQTTAITAPAPAAQLEPAAVPLTFWQKLLKLFGVYKG